MALLYHRKQKVSVRICYQRNRLTSKVGLFEYQVLNGKLIVTTGCENRKTWDTVQEIIRQKKAVTAAVGRIGGRPHFLYGKLFCGECGEPMTRRTLNGPKGIKHKVWTCRGRHEGRKGNGCKCRNVKENELIDTISERIGEELTEENVVMLKKVLIELDDISVEYAENAV